MKVLNGRTKPKNFKSKVLSSDLLVMDLLSAALSGGLDEVEKIIKIIKDHHSSPSAIVKDQTIVLVSSVMTWINTPKKPSTGAKKVEQEPGSRPQTSSEEAENEEEFFTDKDIQQRSPSPKYQQIKTIETMAMAAQRISKHLRVFVLCSGLPYGNGESNDIFYEFYRSAWLSLHPDLASLPIVGTGKNRIPTIHINDLVSCIKHLYLNIPYQPIQMKPQQYFIAVDSAKK